MRNNKEKSRFEIETGGYLVFADYRIENGALVLLHVEAAQELRGTGAAGALMHEIACFARGEGLKILPLCGYAAAWLGRHAEYHDVLRSTMSGR